MSDNVLVMDTKIDLDGFKKGFDAIKNGTTGTAKAVNKTLDTVKKGSMQAAKTANQAIKTVEGAFKKIISIISLKKVFDKFRQYLETNLRKNQEYAASMKALRGSIAGAFQPIYEIAAPAIIYLVKLLNMVVQAIGRFIATLSGKSYSQMLKNSEALSKQKDLLEGVGGAASDAAKQLLGFDEINRLEDNSGGSGGSGMTFNEADLGSAAGAIDDFAKKLRELIQSGQFEEAGELVASCVNKMLDAFDAEKLGSTVGTWVQNFADFMNGLLFGIEWDKIGTVLAGGINGLLSKVKGTTIGEILRLKFTVAIGIFAGFIKDFDGSQAGAFLGDALLGFVQGLGRDIEENFDDEFWDKLNQNIADGFDAFVPKFTDALTSAADTIAQQAPSAIETLGKIGTEVVDAISAALSAMDEEVEIALNQYDENGNQLTKIGTRWEELGYSVAEGLSEIDWEKILSGSIVALGKLAKGIVEFLAAAIDGIDDQKWMDIGASVAEGFNKIPWSEILEKGLVAIGDLAIGLCKMLISALQKVNWTDIGKAIIDGIKSIRWIDLASAILGAALALINAFIELLLGMVDAALGTSLSEKFAEWSGKKQKEYIEKTLEQQKAEAEKAKELVGQWLEDSDSSSFWEGFTEHSVDVQAEGVLSVDRNAYIRSAFQDYQLGNERVSELAKAIDVSQDVVDECAAAFGVTAEKIDGATDALSRLNDESAKANSSGNEVADKWDEAAHTFDDAAKSVDEYIAHFKEYLDGERELGAIIEEGNWLARNGVTSDEVLAGFNKAFDPSDSQYSDALAALQMLIIDALDEVAEKSKEKSEAIGDAIDDGCTNGINDSKGEVIDASGNMMDEATGEMRTRIDSHSPSKVTEKIGIDMVDGLLIGLNTIDDKIGDFIDRFSRIIQKIADVAKKVTATVSSEMSGLSSDSVTATSKVSSDVNGMSTQVDASLAAASSSFADFRNNAITDLSAVCSAMGQLASQASVLGSIQLGRIGTSMRYSSSPKWSVDFSNLYHAADGAVIPPNREFMAVFGDQRTGTNIEAPESLIRQIIREEAGSSGDSARLESLLEELIGTVSSIRIGDDTIGRAATRYSRAHGRATGV